jgi:hypothetical protein
VASSLTETILLCRRPLPCLERKSSHRRVPMEDGDTSGAAPMYKFTARKKRRRLDIHPPSHGVECNGRFPWRIDLSVGRETRVPSTRLLVPFMDANAVFLPELICFQPGRSKTRCSADQPTWSAVYLLTPSPQHVSATIQRSKGAIRRSWRPLPHEARRRAARDPSPTPPPIAEASGADSDPEMWCRLENCPD